MSECQLDRILVPLDGSQFSEDALSFAMTLVRPTTQLTLLHVIPKPRPVHDLHGRHVAVIDEGRDRLHRHALDELHRAVDHYRLAAKGADVQVSVADGDPANEILRTAAHLRSGLIVIAAEGCGANGQFGLGSVADRVARASTVPVLVVRNRSLGTRGDPSVIRRIVVPLDGSDRAMAGVAVAEDLAKRLDAPILLLSVVDEAGFELPMQVPGVGHDDGLYREISALADLDAQCTLDRAGARLMRHKIVLHSMLLIGPAASTIMHATVPGDVIIMTSRGRGSDYRWPIGSVAEKLIASGPIPVVLVPTGREPEILAPSVAEFFQWDPIDAR
ncbi:MAG: universal stress protein [Thermomicrobiales bacterium]